MWKKREQERKLLLWKLSLIFWRDLIKVNKTIIAVALDVGPLFIQLACLEESLGGFVKVWFTLN